MLTDFPPDPTRDWMSTGVHITGSGWCASNTLCLPSAHNPQKALNRYLLNWVCHELVGVNLTSSFVSWCRSQAFENSNKGVWKGQPSVPVQREEGPLPLSPDNRITVQSLRPKPSRNSSHDQQEKGSMLSGLTASTSSGVGSLERCAISTPL